MSVPRGELTASAKDQDHRWPTGHSGRTQRVAGQVFPSLPRSDNKSSMAETLARLRSISLESKALSDELEEEQEEQKLAADSPVCKCEAPKESRQPAPDWMSQWHDNLAQYRTIIKQLGGESQHSERHSPNGAPSPPWLCRALYRDDKQKPFATAHSEAPIQGKSRFAPWADNDSDSDTSLDTPPHGDQAGRRNFFTAGNCSSFKGTQCAHHCSDESDDAKHAGSPPRIGATFPSSNGASPPGTWAPMSDPVSHNEPPHHCSCCIGIGQELQLIRIQLSTQQRTLDRIVADLAYLKTASSGRRPPMHSPPSGPWCPPWRSYRDTFHDHWGPAPMYVPQPLPHLPPPWGRESWCGPIPPPSAPPFPPHHCSPYYNFPKTEKTVPQNLPVAELSKPVAVDTTPPVRVNAHIQPLPATHGVEGEDYRERRISSPKRVSFACPVATEERDSKAAAEGTSKLPREDNVTPSPSLKPSKLGNSGKKASPILKKSSLARPRQHPLTGSLKYQTDVYSSKSPRSYYTSVSSQQPAHKTVVVPAPIHHTKVADGLLGDGVQRTGSPSPKGNHPFTVLAEGGEKDDDEGLHVRFDGATLLYFMRYWQRHAADAQPLVVDLTLDAATYGEFLDWASDSGVIKIQEVDPGVGREPVIGVA